MGREFKLDFFAVDGAGTFVAGGKGGWARGHTVIKSTVIAKCVGKVIGVASRGMV